MKRLKNIEDKNEEQLKMTGNKEIKKLAIKSVTNVFNDEFSTHLVIKKKALTTKDLALREIKT